VKLFQFETILVNILATIAKFHYLHLVANQKISLNGLTSASLALVDAHGFGALNLSSVAAELDVGPSALYTHVDGVAGLRYLVAVASTLELTDGVRNAAIGVSGHEALRAMGHAYRAFAHEYPGRFASTLLPPTSDDSRLANANESLVDVFTIVYRAMGLEPQADRTAARCCRSAIHGFLALEHSTGTSLAHDAEFKHLLGALAVGLAPGL